MAELLKNKVALVTGGSSGIGAAISEIFAQEGASVAVIASSDIAKADRIAAGITSRGGQAQPFAADVRNRSDVESLFTKVEQCFGGIDILINAAGVYYATPI